MIICYNTNVDSLYIDCFRLNCIITNRFDCASLLSHPARVRELKEFAETFPEEPLPVAPCKGA